MDGIGTKKNGMTKYRAKPTTINGTRYASQKEAAYCEQLKLLERSGNIRNLELQPKFPLIVDGIKVATYIADAAFFENNARVIVDVKSKPTKTPVYRLKIKLLKALYPGIDHREV